MTSDDMRFQLNLECNNAAFDDDMRGEIARLLRDVAGRIERGEDCSLFRNAYDINGNPVGTFALKPRRELYPAKR